MEQIDPSTLTNIVVALSGIAISIGTAFITYMSTRASIRNDTIRTDIDQKRAQKDQDFMGVEAAERIGNISLSLAQSMQSQLQEAQMKNEQYATQLHELRSWKNNFLLRTERVIDRLKSIRREHDSLSEGSTCGGIPIINSMVDQLVSELEMVIQENKQ